MTSSGAGDVDLSALSPEEQERIRREFADRDVPRHHPPNAEKPPASRSGGGPGDRGLSSR